MKTFLPSCLTLLSLLIMTQPTVAVYAKPLERWVYCAANLLTQVERVESLMKDAKKLGYTHFLLADSKFARLHELDERYFEHVRKVQATADSLGIKIAPAVFPVGYSNDILGSNPNLADAMPVRDALFIVRDGVADVLAEPLVYLPTLFERSSWGFIDDAWQVDGDSLVATQVGDANCRIMKPLTLAPFRQYHVSVNIKTEAFQGRPEIKLINGSGQSLSYTNLQVKPTQDWQTHHITFNTLANSSINLYIGAWSPENGRLWIAEPMLEECGAVNMVRRSGAPLRVVVESPQGGIELIEGKDFEPFHDPLLGVEPYGGEYQPWHQPPSLRLSSSWPDGTRLRVSYYHTHVIYDGQVCGCATEPEFSQMLTRQADDMTKLWKAESWMMSHDEWRLLGWDESFAKLGKTPGQVVAENVTFCTDLLHDRAPGARVMTWSDMFDPHHNAVENYYLVNGTLRQSWLGLSKEVTVVNWNFDKRVASLRFFADRGHPQIIAGYYDADPEQLARWLETVRDNRVQGVVGVMYTTWQNDYSNLEAFAKVIDRFDTQ